MPLSVSPEDRRPVIFNNRRTMDHKAELKPTWKPITSVPKGTKVLLRLKYGTCIIGIYYPESGAEWWCGLPVFTEKQKERMKK